jgi:hypothetical protein
MNSRRLSNHKPKNPVSEWFSDCKTKEAKEARVSSIEGTSPLFDRLKEMIQLRYDAGLASKDCDYDNASWSHKQAHINGKLEAYEEIFKLIP